MGFRIIKQNHEVLVGNTEKTIQVQKDEERARYKGTLGTLKLEEKIERTKIDGKAETKVKRKNRLVAKR